MIDNALELFKAQAKSANAAAPTVSACIGATPIKIADACNVAAKQCNAPAAQGMKSAPALGATAATSH